jgi:hypothetical protein
MSTLESLITEANAQGWSVSLRQHPDRQDYWECQLTRRAEQNENGIVREVATTIASEPDTAVIDALFNCETDAKRVEPLGLRGGVYPTTPNLLDLLGLTKPTVPMITRRF